MPGCAKLDSGRRSANPAGSTTLISLSGPDRQSTSPRADHGRRLIQTHRMHRFVGIGKVLQVERICLHPQRFMSVSHESFRLHDGYVRPATVDSMSEMWELFRQCYPSSLAPIAPFG